MFRHLYIAFTLCVSGALAGFSNPCDENMAGKGKCVYNPECAEIRKKLPQIVKVKAPLVPPIPRVHVDDLDKPENKHFKERARPFILLGAMDGWKGMERWKLNLDDPKKSYLAKSFPRTVCDYYPYNMLKNGHPYLTRFAAGLNDLLQPPGHFLDPHSKHTFYCKEGCRYLHMQTSRSEWLELEKRGDMPGPLERHWHLEGDNWWMDQCLTNNDVRDEYHLKTHWKIFLFGTEGAGMFNHTDSLLSSSWHGHVEGRKWWYLCGDGHGEGPWQGERRCFESVLHPGEVLYYGKHWWHETRNLDTPTTTITGTVLHKGNWEALTHKLWGECAKGDMSFDFSGALCDALDKCNQVIYKKYMKREKPKSHLPNWRTLASPATIAKKDNRKPTENNYDGRNWIFEG